MNIEQKKAEILAAFDFRHATKVFDADRKISEEDFEFILETGRKSPSSVGLEPWKFVVIQNMELREKIREVTWGGQGQLPTASHLIAILARKDGRYDSQYFWDQMTKVKHFPEELVRDLMQGRYKSFQEQDFKLFENERALFDWASKQTYIALGNMMTAAAQIGIDSCPIEGYDQDRLNAILEAEGLLGNDEYGISVMVAFGYRTKEPRPKTRRTIDMVTQWVE